MKETSRFAVFEELINRTLVQELITVAISYFPALLSCLTLLMLFWHQCNEIFSEVVPDGTVI